MSNSANIPNILKEYEELREKHKRELEQRKKALYAKLPRLEQIENEMIRLSIDITRAILSGKEDKNTLLDALQKKQLDLKIERAEILSANKYPIDYLDLRYQCKLCKDTGFADSKKCTCLIQREIDSLYKQSNLGESLKKENFDQFRLDFYSDEKDESGFSPRDNMKDIYMKCIKYAQNFDGHSSNLLFIGRPGLGKTFLCHSIAKELLDSGKSVIYQTASDLIDLVRKYKFDFNNEDSNAPFLEKIYNCDLLIIDDLGTELETHFSGLVIYNILNRRLSKGKKMVISTNLNTDEIIKIYSERIYSRIFGNFAMLKFFGEDIRLKKRTM